MIYVPAEYDDYVYIVSVSDNYVVLTNTRSIHGTWESPAEIDIIYQYLTPSTLTIEGTRSYSNTQIFNEVDITDDFYSRADCPQLVLCVFSAIFFVLFLINGLTRFIKKGGIFFGT